MGFPRQKKNRRFRDAQKNRKKKKRRGSVQILSRVKVQSKKTAGSSGR